MEGYYGRIAVVTGAAQGIGLAIAKRLVKAGVKGLAILDLNYETAKREAEKLNVEGNTHIIAIKCDVSEAENVKTAFAEVELELGPVDILVNNAAITKDKMFHKMTPEQWHSVINVNLNGVFNCTHFVINGMRDRNYGRIVNISSSSAYGNVGQSNYGASKAAIIGFTKTLARESARKGITVNAVAPDFIDTPMVQLIAAEEIAARVATSPMQRMGKPEEVAALVAFLCSEEASYVSGACMDCSGARYT